MARAFTSASSHKLQNDNAPASDVPLTIATWMRTASTATTQAGVVIGRRSSSSGSRYQLYFTSAGRLAAYCQNGGGTQTATISDASGVNYSANTWYHGAAVFSSTTSRTIYRNGANSATDTNSVTVGTVDTIALGARYDGVGFGLYLNGQLAEAAVWNAALTAAQVAQLAAGYSPMMVRPDALVFYAPLYGNDSPEPDWFGGYNLTVTGATKAAHPRIIYPSRRKIFLPAAATGPTYTLTADVGAFTLSGQAATLTASRLLTAEAGSFSLSGQGASLLASRLLTAEAGAFSLSGQDAGLTASRLLTAEAGSFTITGQDATLTYSPGAATYTLVAEAGVFSLSGQDASLVASRLLTAEAGQFTFTGQGAIISIPQTGLTGRNVPWRSYRRGRLIDDELYWPQESQDIGEIENEVVELAKVRSIPLKSIVADQLAAMQQAIDKARTDKIRKKRAKDLALFEQKLASEQEEAEVLDLLRELMQ